MNTAADIYEFDGVQRQNVEALDIRIEERLQCYVYVYRTLGGRVFYVGKGGGSGAGNSRVLHHFDEAEDALKRRIPPATAKLRAILETWKQEQRVDWFITRHGLDEATAMHVEAALIDAVPMTPNGEIANACRGEIAHGLLLSDEVSALGASRVSPTNPFGKVFVFQIQNALEEKRSLFDAIRGVWRVNEVNRSLDAPVMAVGVRGGISQIVCSIDEWLPVGNKYAFNGAVLDDHELLHKSFVHVMSPARGFLMFGGGYTIVRFDGKGMFQCRRGCKTPDNWLMC